MKVSLTKYANAGNLLVDVNEAIPPENIGPNEVLIEVKVCGVNFADIYNRRGLPTGENRKPSFPMVCGLECVGIVKVIGLEVKEFKVDDHVAYFNGIYGGMWQSYVVADVRYCHYMPKEIPMTDCATFCVNYGTAYHVLFNQGNLRPGDQILIDSAGGGVGFAATQLSKTVDDVKVYGMASAKKHLSIIQNGVDETIDSETEDQFSTLQGLAPQGFDLIIDMQSGYKFTEKLRLVSPLGRLIHTGGFTMLSPSWSTWSVLKSWWGLKNIRVIDLILNNINVSGFNLTRLVQKQPERHKEVLAEIIKLHKEGKIKPKIDSIYTFQEVEEAYCRMEKRENIGKILLVPKKE